MTNTRTKREIALANLSKIQERTGRPKKFTGGTFCVRLSQEQQDKINSIVNALGVDKGEVVRWMIDAYQEDLAAKNNLAVG